jgi:hypothetical protein
MNRLTNLLSEVYGANLSHVFLKRASYNSTMDFLEYVSIDEVTISDRIDPFLTVMWNFDQTEIVGFRLKGFHCIFNKYIKPLFELKDADFEPLVDALKYVYTAIGDELFATQGLVNQDGESQSHRAAAYKLTMKLVKEEKINLPPQFQRAA